MPPHDFAPLMMGITLTLAVAAVLILRPLAKHVGNVLEMRARHRYEGPQVSSDDVMRLTDAVGRLTDRIETLEDRQDFAERLLDTQRSSPRARLAEPGDT